MERPRLESVHVTIFVCLPLSRCVPFSNHPSGLPPLAAYLFVSVPFSLNVCDFVVSIFVCLHLFVPLFSKLSLPSCL